MNFNCTNANNLILEMKCLLWLNYYYIGCECMNLFCLVTWHGPVLYYDLYEEFRKKSKKKSGNSYQKDISYYLPHLNPSKNYYI